MRLYIDQFDAVGHSSGAAALLYLASRAPARVGRMVVIGMGAKLTEELRSTLRSYPALEQLPPLFRNYFTRVHPGGEVQAKELLGYIRGVGTDTTDINFDSEMLARISAMTLIVVGDRDGHTVENVTTLYRMIPESRLWIIPNQGHWPFWPEWGGDSTMAQIFPTVLRQFLAGKSP